MAITEVAYCTREDVQRALNLADVPRLNQRVDSAVMAGARQVEGFLHRRFYPETKTLAFDQPEGENLWLYEYELAAAPTSIISGAQPMTIGTDVFLRPRSGPPYRWLEVAFSGNVFWQSLNTPQDAIHITGDFGYPAAVTAVTTLGASAASGGATLTVTDSSGVGVGSLILVDSERMIVSDSTLAASGATLAADLTASKSVTAVTVSDGTQIHPGELIYLDAERMFIESVAGNTVTVTRAVNGSVLAAHTSTAVIYAPRVITVLRARLGTTAAAHSAAAAVSLLRAPSLVRELNLAYAINNEEQAIAAYAQSTGSGDNQRPATGRGVVDIAEDTYTTYGRKSRSRAVRW